MKSVDKILTDIHKSQVRACKAINQMVEHGYLVNQGFWIGHGSEAEVVHTIMFPPPRKNGVGAMFNWCPGCGSKFTPGEGERPPVPNCATPEEPPEWTKESTT